MARKKRSDSRVAKLVARTQARTRRLTGLPQSASDIPGFIRSTGAGNIGITPKTAKQIGGTKGIKFATERKRAAQQLRTLRALGRAALARRQAAKPPPKKPPSRVTVTGPQAAQKAKAIALKRARKGLGTKITKKTLPKAKPIAAKPPPFRKGTSTLTSPSKSLAFQRLIKRRKKS